MTDSRLDQLFTLGFDKSYRVGRNDVGQFSKAIRVACSQCEALVICGVPCHETGCPRQTGTCGECGDTVPNRIRTCESCANPEPFDDDDQDDQDDDDDESELDDDDDRESI